MRKPVVLYFSYDGILESLGYSQVFQYLKGLSLSFPLVLVSFEKKKSWEDSHKVTKLKDEAKGLGIHWIPLRYHKRPAVLSTVFDVAVGVATALTLSFRYRISLIHCRSYVAGLMGWLLNRSVRIPFLFDMRGFWPEEKVEAGTWSAKSPVFKTFKYLEKKLLKDSVKIITLTEAAKAELVRAFLITESKIQVIPTCADLDQFTLGKKENRDKKVLGYVGSVLRYRFDIVLSFFSELRKISEEWTLEVFNEGEHPYLYQCIQNAGADWNKIKIRTATVKEMPSHMMAFSASIILANPSYSKLGTAPTRLGELLGCGVPTVVSQGLGDAAQIVEQNHCGLALRNFTEEEIQNKAKALEEMLRDREISMRCTKTAERYFSLKRGVSLYGNVYRQLLDEACFLYATATQ